MAGSDGEADDAALAAAGRASLLREMRSICSQLDELRVPTKGNDAKVSTFEEPFAFGQALALAREAGREARRALNDGEVVAVAAAPSASTTAAMMPSAPVATGRRAW